MLFVGLLKVRAGTEEERVARRLQWQIPEGIKAVGEYWLHTTDPEVIVIFEADSYPPMLMFTAAWNEVYDITIVPATSAEDGIEMVKQMMA